MNTCYNVILEFIQNAKISSVKRIKRVLLITINMCDSSSTSIILRKNGGLLQNWESCNISTTKCLIINTIHHFGENELLFLKVNISLTASYPFPKC